MLENANRTSHYIRTDKAIVQTFCQLLKKKPYDKITIQNILDATPISRAAFYQHFADKEAIGEQMLEEYGKIKDEIVRQMALLGESHYTSIVRQSSKEHRELVDALLKIHTPRVDLASVLEKQLEELYMKTSGSPACEYEAKIYAAALTKYQLITMNLPDPSTAGDATFYNQVMIEVFLNLMRWQDDDALRKFLHNKLRQTREPHR